MIRRKGSCARSSEKTLIFGIIVRGLLLWSIGFSACGPNNSASSRPPAQEDKTAQPPVHAPTASTASIQDTVKFIGNLTWLGQEDLSFPDPNNPCIVTAVTRSYGYAAKKITYTINFSDFNPESIRVGKAANSAFDNAVHMRTTDAQKTIQIDRVVVHQPQPVRERQAELHLSTTTEGDAEKVRKALLHLLERCHAKPDLF